MAKSNSSPRNITTDFDDDRLHSYPTPVPAGQNLFIRTSPFGGLVCHACPNRMPRGWNEADARAHVLAKACGLRDGYYTNDKSIARRRALARSQDWMD
jgi:hypothetical protein